MDKKNPNKLKEKKTNAKQKIWIYQNIVKHFKQKPGGYINNTIKPFMGADGYLHCFYCRRRYEPEHRCEQQYL